MNNSKEMLSWEVKTLILILHNTITGVLNVSNLVQGTS